MADEIIYLSPEEDVTSVHERLERISARRILLVVPPQTTLRSLTSWRVLRSYARELDKEMLVVTSDRQIRSVAKEAQFRVANSLESPASSKGQGGSNASRSGVSRIAALRGQATRGGGRTQRSRQSLGPTQDARRDAGAPPSIPRPQMLPRSPLPPPKPLQPPQSTNEAHFFAPGQMEENTDLGSASSSFGRSEHEERYAPPFDFRVSSSSHLHPVEAQPEQDDDDEDLDSFDYNYQQSQKILHAAQQQHEPENEVAVEKPDETNTMVAPAGEAHAANGIPNSQAKRPQEPWLPTPATPVDPYAQMADDFPPLPLSEQRGAVINPVHEFHDGEDVVDISQYPTADIQAPGGVEDLGDLGMDELPPLGHRLEPSPSWEEEEGEEEEEEAPPYSYSSRMRSGTLSSRAMTADTEEEEDLNEDLPSIEDQPTRVISPVLGLPDAVTGRNANRVSPTSPLAERRGIPTGPMSRQKEPSVVALPPVTQRRSQSLSTPSTSKRPVVTAKPKRPTAGQAQRKPASRSQKKRPVNWVTPVVVIGAFLLIGIIVFLIPSADVTVVLATKSYSWPVVATASSTSKQDVTLHTVPLLTAHFTATVKKTGPASGTNTTVGTAPATGIVQFTNTGSNLVTIRQGIVVSTANNILFVTTAQAVVTANGGINFVPVQAQTPGANGNVDAGSITIIPASSISQISQDSKGVTVKLSVTNPNPTTGGGGAGQQATTVTVKDVSTLQSSINTELQAKLQAWITQQERQQNSVLAIPVPQSQLSKGEVVTATPAAGAVAANGKFSETVSVDLPVQFVRKSDLQAQANAQYTQLSKETKPAKGFVKPPTGYTLIQGYAVQLTPVTCNSSSKGSTANASTLCFSARAPVALPISVQEVQSLVTGKQVQTVKQSLPNSVNGLPGVKSVDVNVFPGFWPWLPFWTQRISVHFTTAI